MAAMYFEDDTVTLYHGDALDAARSMRPGSVDCIVTSPPYYDQRDYGEDGQHGLEDTPEEYIEVLRAVFCELLDRVLTADGTLWLNIGDTYASRPSHTRGRNSQFNGRKHDAAQMMKSAQRRRSRSPALPQKNLIGIPWRLALALQEDGWYLHSDIIWDKPNAQPESVRDRPTRVHEYIFLFTKSEKYWYDPDPLRVKGTNARDVWSIPTQPFPDVHFAVMPVAVADRCVQAGCKPAGTVLDPFSGIGTTGLAAARNGRKFVGVDLSEKYLAMSLRTRLAGRTIDFGEAS